LEIEEGPQLLEGAEKKKRKKRSRWPHTSTRSGMENKSGAGGTQRYTAKGGAPNMFKKKMAAIIEKKAQEFRKNDAAAGLEGGHRTNKRNRGICFAGKGGQRPE